MSEAPSSQVVTLGDCTLDLGTGLLLRGHEPVQLRAKAFCLLAHLASHSGRVVTKSDLMAAVWGDVFVTEDSLTQAVREIRRALADDDQKLVRTVARRGYMLAPSATAPANDTGKLPTLAVLRFANAGDPADDPLVDGLAEDIINGLARFRTMVVLGRSSTFSASDAKAAARLGADFAVEGSVRRKAERLDVGVTLSSVPAGGIVWSERYSAEGTDIFAVLDDIVEQILNRLARRLEDAGLHQTDGKPTGSLAAYELLLRGIGRLRGYLPEDNEAARSFFEAAIEKDPGYGLAHAYLGLTLTILGGYALTPAPVLAEAIAAGAKGVTLAPEEPRCHRLLGIIRLFARQHSGAESHLRRALDLNPHDADTMVQLGYLLTLRGRPLEGLALMDKAERINPIHPDWYDYDRSMALYGIGDYSGAAACLERLTSQSPWRLTRLAACLAQEGKTTEAQQTLDRVQELAPEFSPHDYARHGVAFEHSSDVEHLAEGVLKAMGDA